MTYEQAMETLQRICEKLNVAAEYLIPKLTRLKIVENGMSLALSTAIFIAVFKILKWAGKEMVERNLSDSYDGWPEITVAISAIAAAISVIAFAYYAVELATWIAAPEVKGIEYIIHLVG